MVDPSYRIFKSKPLPSFSEQVRAHLREHHQPELISDLRHEPIAKTERFDILCEISVDPSKRPEQDLAPCPMCQPNKFIHGRLCYFPDLGCCAIIGHCCADKKHREDAERRYREESTASWQEDYFIAALPLVPLKLEIVAAIRPKAEEALRLHKKFRRDANDVMHMLRGVAKHHGGRLRVLYEVEQQAAINDTPGSGRFDRLVDANDYGVLEGLTALRPKYDPVLELNAISAVLERAFVGTDEGRVVDAIIALDPKERDRSYAAMTSIDHTQWPRLVSKLEDFASFFEHDNLQRLARWGGDAKNRDRVAVVDRALNLGRRQVEIAGAGRRTMLSPGQELEIAIPEWPVVPKRRR